MLNKPSAALGAFIRFAVLCFSTAAGADSIINDDLIVTGNVCIGFDCTNNYSFAEDELVLSENNTRIAFGSAGQFRLAANSSLNGGDNEFRIDAIQEPIVLVGESAVIGSTFYYLPDAVQQPDGTLVVALVEENGLVSLSNLPDLASDAKIALTPGQTAILPAGSWTNTTSIFYETVRDTPITSTATSGGFDAQITGGAESLVAFDESGSIVTLGKNSERVAGAVSVGSDTTQRQFLEVADAVSANDVINVGQLTRSLSLPKASILRSRLQAETSRLEGVSAMTAAMSALQPNPRAQGPVSISLGLGSYKGETAAGVGMLFRVSDASHLQLSFAGAEDTSPQTSISLKIVW